MSTLRSILLLLLFLLTLTVTGRAAAPSVLYSFTGSADGTYPHASLAAATDGTLYGATSNGGYAPGTLGGGTIFKVTAAGALTTLYTFPNTGSNGSGPNSLLIGTDGNLYGTTASTVFQVTTGGVAKTLHTFTGGTDGGVPNGIVQGSDGNLYGTTGTGGSGGFGTVFQVTTAGTLTTLHAFTGGTDGASPQAMVIQGSDGNLYGTTAYGGAGTGYAGYGTAFQMTTAGALTTLHAFDGAAEGAYPYAPLADGGDGDLYGTTSGSTTSGNRGTVFQVSPGSAFKTLYAFTGKADGDGPVAGLTLAGNGLFYGLTRTGGLNGSSGLADGTLFTITTGGTLTTLATFTGGSTGAANPYAALTFGADGNLYGTTVNGGADARGTVIQLAVGILSGTPTPTPTPTATPTPTPSATPTPTPTPASVPTVNIYAGGSGMFSKGNGKGKLVFNRSGGDTSTALTVYYKVKGSAANGSDYTGPGGVALSGSVVIPAGETTLKLKLKALAVLTSREKIKVSLKADPAGSYQLGTSTVATLSME